MSFTPLIPASGQSLGSSRTQVLNNFASLRSTLAANHVDVNSANPGLHTHADLLAQSADPNPPVKAVSHYSKQVSGITEWFFQRENSGSVFQMSNGDPSVSSNFPTSSGQTFLPGGFILQWGFYTVTSPFAGSIQVSLNTNFPNNALTGWATSSSVGPPSAIGVSNIITSKITISWGNGNPPYNIFWFAIGN
jgi:hypothetical protein